MNLLQLFSLYLNSSECVYLGTFPFAALPGKQAKFVFNFFFFLPSLEWIDCCCCCCTVEVLISEIHMYRVKRDT